MSIKNQSDLGANAWIVDEMYREYLANPSQVSESWREFFVDYKPGSGAVSPTQVVTPAHAATPVAPITATPASPVTNGATPPAAAPAHAAAPVELPDGAEPLRGIAAKIVENMELSLDVPTATSFRDVPARLLEVNRKIVNGHLGRTRGGKISFTHIIGYAIVRAIADTVPAMNNGFVEGEDGKPNVIRRTNVGLGIAIDVEKSDGSRTLMVPAIKNANELDFATFVDVYDDLVRRGRAGKLTLDDFSGITVSLTNPGGIGTVQSVPRLMPGQGAIIGLGSIAYPTAFAAADPAKLAEIGVSKIVTITSTYDHRIIQGAESGLFLKAVHELLMGEDEFYEGVLGSMGVPYDAVKWRRDINPVDDAESVVERQVKVNSLVNAHRVRGHLIANLDPLGLMDRHIHPELDPASYGLTIWDLEREFHVEGLFGPQAAKGRSKMKLADILGVMRDAYARTIGVEYMHMANPDEKLWIQEHVEGQSFEVDRDTQRHILGRLNAAEALEKFLGTKYIGQKRFGIEGAESAVPILDRLLNSAADSDMTDVVIGMAHRGRLNVLVNIVGKDYHQLFEEFEGAITADAVQGSGDVKYHLGQTGTFTSRSGNPIPVTLAANPSHLEAVDPVVVGMARAKMDRVEMNLDRMYPVLPILIHGDAAFAGQGVVTETLNLSQIRGYKVGGTIHLIINNQLGFTTAPHAARSSEYSTDVAKLIQAPIFHVNADDPEACVRVAQLAFEYRERFKKDVVIDMIGYRRHGHNEGDDPSYTQPLMYRAIEGRRSVRKIYTESLIKRGDLTVEEAEHALDDFRSRLQDALDTTRSVEHDPDIVAAKPPEPKGVLPPAPTAVSKEALDRVYSALSSVPEGFTIHPKLKKQFATRDEMYATGEVDWALGEALAYGTLLDEGVSVRLSGQDSRRGTFSHRHSTLVDYETGEEIVPLAGAENDSKLWIYDSLLSEYASLGFEYGYSVERTDVLTLWEAQFGDFMNGAQIIIDQFIMAAEDKWGQFSDLVMLLPHGYEGQGPEHSSARVERFLLLAAEDNVQIANVTTASQFFHLLRRQMHREVRKPLVVFTPKSLLRAKTTRSPVLSLTEGAFRETLEDPNPPSPGEVDDLVFATGKVAVDAFARRDEVGSKALITRVEQLYPWPKEQIAAVVAAHPNARRIVWLQEEPENMGAWNFVKGRLYDGHGSTHKIQRFSRPESGSPSCGSARVHAQEQDQLLRELFGG
ncbi:MAG: multifunctional oxoglutarate decarboxylase/oxoglutarate dehydrogenase thiamine pyrophosphate-binding subunit/dihydrolipoyllysine-residue succinyltransferase subunit [Acidimicrobiia bacterium]|nr:multifunctional oxoglutarate decarboxylase/oxoglutarate dehydrogenase thiamine pyrophosphate-binding subunit/dihydrolipoyllysine-residue succinyltransferase subunit [Acidimicrobiia bacterium]